ncbi:hypothetical protein ALC53_11945 [Atta colombica]|uniref:Uncharacterized protein n=1 Tax=Atta colombica TaxID=520822 RepID=A0A195B070_9HYME|nr:hypothetical protein ALC53_11945 [Atta colombica]
MFQSFIGLHVEMPTAKELRARIVMRIINSKDTRRDKDKCVYYIAHTCTGVENTRSNRFSQESPGTMQHISSCSLLSLSRLLNSWAVNPNLLIHSTISLIPVFSTSYLNFPRCVARATIADRIPGKPNSDILEAISPALILLGSYVTSALAAIKATNMLFTPYSFLQCFSIAATQEPQNKIRLRSLNVIRFFHIRVEAQLLLMLTFFILGFLDRAPTEEDIYDSYRKFFRYGIDESRTPSLFYLQMSTHRLVGRGSGESHFFDRLRQYLWRSLIGLILNIAGFLLQNYPEVNDIGPFADYPLDVRHATLAGHALNVDFNRVGLLHELPCFRHARYAHQVRGTLVIGVVGAIPVKFNSKLRIVQRVKDNGKKTSVGHTYLEFRQKFSLSAIHGSRITIVYRLRSTYKQISQRVLQTTIFIEVAFNSPKSLPKSINGAISFTTKKRQPFFTIHHQIEPEENSTSLSIYSLIKTAIQNRDSIATNVNKPNRISYRYSPWKLQRPTIVRLFQKRERSRFLQSCESKAAYKWGIHGTKILCDTRHELISPSD